MKKCILDAETMKRTIRRLSYEIIERNQDLNNVVLLGIKTKGVYLCKRIQDDIMKIEGINIPSSEIDITSYRDDVVDKVGKEINKQSIPFSVEGKIVILIDDVLFTGRTVRAAMDAVMDIGRAESIQLVVLVDRGHRQLPIKAHFIGKNIPTSLSEKIKVNFIEVDGINSVDIIREV